MPARKIKALPFQEIRFASVVSPTPKLTGRLSTPLYPVVPSIPGNSIAEQLVRIDSAAVELGIGPTFYLKPHQTATQAATPRF